MTPRIPMRTDDRDHRTVGTKRRDTIARLERSESRLEDVTARLERAESRLLLLENTLHGVARRTGASIGSPCDHCDRSLLFVIDGMMTCPACGYQQSI